VLGPYGVRLLDREILKYISKEYVPLTLGMLQANQKPCEILNEHYFDDSVFDALKNFQNLEPFTVACSALGLTLKFRELLYTALGNVTRQKIPYIYDVVSSTFNQYTRNTFMVPDYIAIDMLAKYVGVNVGTADQLLKSYIGKAFAKHENGLTLSAQLPTLFAASFATKFWAEATKCYRANVEAFQNNAHVLSSTIHDLILSIKVTNTTNENLQEIINLLARFVEISSTIFLKLSKY
jgi:hypothetical protein